MKQTIIAALALAILFPAVSFAQPQDDLEARRIVLMQQIIELLQQRIAYLEALLLEMHGITPQVLGISTSVDTEQEEEPRRRGGGGGGSSRSNNTTAEDVTSETEEATETDELVGEILTLDSLVIEGNMSDVDVLSALSVVGFLSDAQAASTSARADIQFSNDTNHSYESTFGSYGWSGDFALDLEKFNYLVYAESTDDQDVFFSDINTILSNDQFSLTFHVINTGDRFAVTDDLKSITSYNFLITGVSIAYRIGETVHTESIVFDDTEMFEINLSFFEDDGEYIIDLNRAQFIHLMLDNDDDTAARAELEEMIASLMVYLNELGGDTSDLPLEAEWSEMSIQELQALVNELLSRIAALESSEPYEAEVDISLSSSNPDATNIVVDRDDTTDNVTIFVFDLTADGGTVTQNTIVVRVDTLGADIESVVDDAKLYIDGEQFFAEPFGTLVASNSELNGTSSAWYFFDLDGDLVLFDNFDTEVEFVVDLKPQTGNYENGQTIEASITSVERAYWEAEGYDDLAPEAFNGSAISDTHTLIAEGIFVPVDGFDSETTTLGDNGTRGEFELEFEVTAVEDDYYVTQFATRAGTNEGVEFSIVGPNFAAGTTTAVLTSTADEDTIGVFTIREGETETFVLSVVFDPEVTGSYRVELDEIHFTANPDGITDIIVYDFVPVSDFRSDYLVIKEN